MAKMKADTDEASQKREQALRKEKVDADEVTRKREQLYMAVSYTHLTLPTIYSV